MLLLVQYAAAACSGNGYLSWTSPVSNYPTGGKSFTHGTLFADDQYLAKIDEMFGLTSSSGETCSL